MIVDSGASCNMVGCLLWEFLKQNKVKCTSCKSSVKVYSYGHSVPLRTAGCFTANVKLGNVTIEAEFTVIEEEGQALLEIETAYNLVFWPLVGKSVSTL